MLRSIFQVFDQIISSLLPGLPLQEEAGLLDMGEESGVSVPPVAVHVVRLVVCGSLAPLQMTVCHLECYRSLHIFVHVFAQRCF